MSGREGLWIHRYNLVSSQNINSSCDLFSSLRTCNLGTTSGKFLSSSEQSVSSNMAST